jgi:predicted flap endonuclease-1-like 5' DNA nuclease
MAGKMSKMDAVRQAISELGKDASPIKIQEFVKSKFKMDMTTAHVSTYKTTVLREKGKKPVAAPASAPAPVKAAPAPAKGSAVSLSDLEAVKGLVGRVGEENLKSLIGILGR